MGNTQMKKGEDGQKNPKDINILIQKLLSNRPNKTMVFDGVAKVKILNPESIIDQILFRYHRFIGTAKHKVDLFSKLNNTGRLIRKKVSNGIEVVKNPKSILTEMVFRYHRFTGTVKHKTEMFYKLKYLDFKINSIAKLKNTRNYVVNHKKQFTIATSMIIILVTGIIVYDANIGYKVTFNGKEVGSVKEQEIFTDAVEIVNRELSEKYSRNIVFNKDIEFERSFIHKKELLASTDDSVQAVYSTGIDLSVKGAVLVIEGEEVAAFASVDNAKKALEGVIEPFIQESSKTKIVGEPKIEEEYEIIEKVVGFGTVMEVDQAIALLSQGTEAIKEYKVKKGDTSWDIAVNRGFSIKDLENANPEKDITKLHDGDIIKLTAHEPYLTVATVKEEITEKKIKFDTVYQKDSSTYVGKTKVISPGKNGIEQITSEVIYENGIEVSREKLETEVIKEPVDQVVAKGTKPIPAGAGTGRFSMPTSGRVTATNKPGSHAGFRAVDIANSRGTTIKAADNGRVVFASYKGSYGNTIIVDHGNGYQTLYAHLSSNNVSVGQTVSKGQKIGSMGSTGRSTGSHLHFEIRKNGVQQRIPDFFNLSKGMRVS